MYFQPLFTLPILCLLFHSFKLCIIRFINLVKRENFDKSNMVGQTAPIQVYRQRIMHGTLQFSSENLQRLSRTHASQGVSILMDKIKFLPSQKRTLQVTKPKGNCNPIPCLKSLVSHLWNFKSWIKLTYDKITYICCVINEFNLTFEVQNTGNKAFQNASF